MIGRENETAPSGERRSLTELGFPEWQAGLTDCGQGRILGPKWARFVLDRQDQDGI